MALDTSLDLGIVASPACQARQHSYGLLLHRVSVVKHAMKFSSILLILKTRYAPQMERRNGEPEDDSCARPRTLQCRRSRNVPLRATTNCLVEPADSPLPR